MALCKRHSYGTTSSESGPCCMCEGERLSLTDRKEFTFPGRKRGPKPKDKDFVASPEVEREDLSGVRSLSIDPGFDA